MVQVWGGISTGNGRDIKSGRLYHAAPFGGVRNGIKRQGFTLPFLLLDQLFRAIIQRIE